MKAPTKAQLITEHEKVVGEMREEQKRLLVRIYELEAEAQKLTDQNQALKNALLSSRELEQRQPLQTTDTETEPGNEEGSGLWEWWARVRCAFGRHDPTPQTWQGSVKQCARCEFVWVDKGA